MKRLSLNMQDWYFVEYLIKIMQEILPKAPRVLVIILYYLNSIRFAQVQLKFQGLSMLKVGVSI